eukprot:3663049-Prorocentrum_lima.AAC.1
MTQRRRHSLTVISVEVETGSLAVPLVYRAAHGKAPLEVPFDTAASVYWAPAVGRVLLVRHMLVWQEPSPLRQAEESSVE